MDYFKIKNMIIVLIILGVFVYPVIGRVVVNSVNYIDLYSNFTEDVTNFIIMVGCPLVLFYELVEIVGDWIHDLIY